MTYFGGTRNQFFERLKLTNCFDISKYSRDEYFCIASPSCAAYALKQTAIENVAKVNDFTVNTIIHKFYASDCLCSTGTKDEAIAFIKQ